MKRPLLWAGVLAMLWSATAAAAAPSDLKSQPETPVTAKPAGADELPRLAVTDLVAVGASPQQAAALTDAVVAALSNRKLFQVVSTRDLQTLLGAERQKQLLGVCESDPSACASDIASATVARFVLSGQLARVGSAFQLSLQMVDTQKGQPVARSTRLAGDLETLRSLVAYAAAEATGSPLPPPPSRVVPISLMAAGGGALVAGGVVGLLALAQQSALNDELCPTGVVPGERCAGVNLHPRDFYVQKQGSLKTQQGLALGLMAGGAVLAGLGIWLMPPSERTGVAALLVPGPEGFAVVGVFP